MYTFVSLHVFFFPLPYTDLQFPFFVMTGFNNTLTLLLYWVSRFFTLIEVAPVHVHTRVQIHEVSSTTYGFFLFRIFRPSRPYVCITSPLIVFLYTHWGVVSILSGFCYLTKNLQLKTTSKRKTKHLMTERHRSVLRRIWVSIYFLSRVLSLFLLRDLREEYTCDWNNLVLGGWILDKLVLMQESWE